MQAVHISKAILISLSLVFLGLGNGFAAENTFVERIKKQNLLANKTTKANLLAAAEAGDVEAQYRIAVIYKNEAVGYLHNHERYLYWLTKAADANHAHAQFELGTIYLEGKVVTKNLSAAVALLIKSANAGDVDGQEKLAYAIENGLGLVKDVKNAIAWYEFAAQKFDPKNELSRAGAVAKLVSVYFDGKLTAPDYAKVYKYASLLAQRPLDWYGHTYLAHLYEGGLGIPKNERLALQHYLIALQNNTDIHNEYGRNQALYLVGMMYLEGRGTQSNVATAATYFKLDHGNPESAKQLTKLNGLKLIPLKIMPTLQLAAPNKLFDQTKPTLSIGSNGKSVLAPLVELLAPKKNYNILTIEEMLTDVAAKNIDAQFYLGQLYRLGKRDLAKNKKLANEFYERAAKQGHAHAQSFVATYYFDQNDQQTALFWLDKSLAANNPNAQVIKGLLYERGVTVEKNIQTAMIWHDKAAQQFDPNDEEPLIVPITKLIWYYFDGLNAPKNYKKVEEYALKLAEISTDAVGNLYLGQLYENGWHVQKNEKAALKYYTESIRNHQDKNNQYGSNEALYYAGKMYLDGRGTEPNLIIAKNYFMLDKTSKRAAETLKQINQISQQKLKPRIEIQKPDYRNFFEELEVIAQTITPEKRAMMGKIAAAEKIVASQIKPIQQSSPINLRSLKPKELERLAQNGDIFAQFYLGSEYNKGYGNFDKDSNLAFEWTKKAAIGGNVQAQAALGWFYTDPDTGRKNLVESFKWDKIAALNGSQKGQGNLGYDYEEGLGVAKDMAYAIAWHKQAAKQYVPNSYASSDFSVRRLALHYFYGYKIARDYDLVKKYADLLVLDKGNKSGHGYLGFLYEKGHGVAKDEKLAIKYYLVAAEFDSSAQYRLGLMYLEGRGVKLDEKLSIQYLKQAAKNYDLEAQSTLDAMNIKY